MTKPIKIKLDKNDNLPAHPNFVKAWKSDNRFDLRCFLMKGYLFTPCGGYGGPKGIKKDCLGVKVGRGQPKPILLEIEKWECTMGDERHIPDYWKESRLYCSLRCPYCRRVPREAKKMSEAMSKNA